MKGEDENVFDQMSFLALSFPRIVYIRAVGFVVKVYINNPPSTTNNPQQTKAITFISICHAHGKGFVIFLYKEHKYNI